MAAVTSSSVNISNAAPKDKSTLNTSQNPKKCFIYEKEGCILYNHTKKECDKLKKKYK